LEPRVRPITEDDIKAATELGARTGFDTEASTWRWILSLGRGLCIALPDGALVGTVVLIPFGPALAMVAMMMVRDDYRRRGLGKLLMRAALDLEEIATVALYATEVGEKLYRAIGFVPASASVRVEGSIRAQEPRRDARLRPLRPSDFSEIVRLDAEAQGAPRAQLLSTLLPPALDTAHGFVLERDETHLEGFGIATVDLATWRIGPLVAERDEDAVLLVSRLAEGKERIRMDIEPDETALSAWAREAGLAEGEISPRMTLGRPMPGKRHQSRALVGRPFG
jgi:GNAT superfamily N-acetyltransferase